MLARAVGSIEHVQAPQSCSAMVVTGPVLRQVCMSMTAPHVVEADTGPTAAGSRFMSDRTLACVGKKGGYAAQSGEVRLSQVTAVKWCRFAILFPCFELRFGTCPRFCYFWAKNFGRLRPDQICYLA